MNLTYLLLGIGTAMAEGAPAGDVPAEMSGPASIVAMLGSLLTVLRDVEGIDLTPLRRVMEA